MKHRPTLHRQSSIIDLAQRRASREYDKRVVSIDEIERRLRADARHIALGVNPGDEVLLTDTPGCIIPAGWHTVSHVNPDGTFRVGGNTAVMPERVAEIRRFRAEPHVPVRELIVMLACAGLIGFALAVGGF